MKQAIALVSALALPASTYAADAASKSAFENLIVATAPVIMLFFLMWLAMRLASRKTNSVNERIVESNERIAKSLEDLVSILRKKEQE
jgi:preprotein translocase subunit SecG